jgi:hypothetical protein
MYNETNIEQNKSQKFLQKCYEFDVKNEVLNIIQLKTE